MFFEFIGVLMLFISVPLLVLIYYFSEYKNKLKMLDNNITMEGIIKKYNKSYVYIYPIIEFIDNGELKTLSKVYRIERYRLMKIGSKVRVLKLADGSYLNDYDIIYYKTRIITMLFIIFSQFIMLLSLMIFLN